jgi:hypothetical protein
VTVVAIGRFLAFAIVRASVRGLGGTDNSRKVAFVIRAARNDIDCKCRPAILIPHHRKTQETNMDTSRLLILLVAILITVGEALVFVGETAGLN